MAKKREEEVPSSCRTLVTREWDRRGNEGRDGNPDALTWRMLTRLTARNRLALSLAGMLSQTKAPFEDNAETRHESPIYYHAQPALDLEGTSVHGLAHALLAQMVFTLPV
jgi:hypothetical protein